VRQEDCGWWAGGHWLLRACYENWVGLFLPFDLHPATQKVPPHLTHTSIIRRVIQRTHIAHTRSPTHANTHTHKHANTRTHTRTHTHTTTTTHTPHLEGQGQQQWLTGVGGLKARRPPITGGAVMGRRCQGGNPVGAGTHGSEHFRRGRRAHISAGAQGSTRLSSACVGRHARGCMFGAGMQGATCTRARERA